MLLWLSALCLIIRCRLKALVTIGYDVIDKNLGLAMLRTGSQLCTVKKMSKNYFFQDKVKFTSHLFRNTNHCGDFTKIKD